MNKTGNITLLRGDCLEILPTIADKSVDAVICGGFCSKFLAMSKKFRNFAIANKMIVNYPEWATVIAQRVWAFFMSILYPHTAVSLRKINAFRGYHLVSSANDTAFCVCNPSKTR